MNVFVVFIILFVYKSNCEDNFKLQQVLILSRHNVRTPLAKLDDYTPKRWPVWQEEAGFLTAKGFKLEGNMGEFFTSWLQKEGLLTKDCPNDDIFVYSNSMERALSSAKAFVKNASPSCNITISHVDNVDPIFHPSIKNKTSMFKLEASDEIQTYLKSLTLNHSYLHVEEILDFKNSKYCLKKNKCDLITEKNKILVKAGFRPSVEGPLKILKSVVDAFIMEYYEGFEINDVAWGQLRSIEQWDNIVGVVESYLHAVYNTNLIAREIAKPLINFMRNLLLKTNYKVIFLMGHDSNMYTVMNSMGFQPFVLENQLEKVPAGGKLVFQKWLDPKSGLFYFKVDFVYQTTDQMRKGQKLSLESPPKFTKLNLEGCKIDSNGYCLWDDFVNILNSL